MKKNDIIEIGKKNYNLNSKIISQVLEFVFNLEKEKVFLTQNFDDAYNGQIFYIFEKLKNNYPIEYITEKSNFFGYDFFVKDGVLIPRFDTELLVEKVIFYINNFKKQNLYLLDIGLGSGIIPISILKNIGDKIKYFYGIDISKKAIEVSKINFFNHKIYNNFELIQSDLKKFDYNIFENEYLVITSNLPYIKNNDFENMGKNVYKYEPKEALYGGEKTGFELYEDLINLLFLKKNIFKSLVLFIEIGFDQFKYSSEFLTKKGLKFEFFKDTNSITRVIKIIF